MTEQEAISRFYTPEEVAEQLGKHIASLTIRRLVAQGLVPAHRGARQKVLMDAADIAALKDHLRFTPAVEAPEEEDVFKTTSRSKARAAS